MPSRRLAPETFIATFVLASVAAMSAGYALDTVGFAMSPALLAMAAGLGAAVGFVAFRESSAPPAGSALLCAAVVAGLLAYSLWLGSPSLLPVTDGPDVVHHLLLIHVIQRTHHLVHGAGLSPYLLEMIDYTPGSHIVAATVAEWLRVDALRVLFPLTAAFVAVKAGATYALALRVLPDKPGPSLPALAAPVLLLVPSAYVLGSFFRFYFYAQVVSETFAIAMVLGGVNWMRTRDRRHLWLVAACGVGVFLSWPVWIPPVLAAVLTAILLASSSWRERASATAVILLPLAVFAALHASAHSAGASIVGSSGAVTKPSAETLGDLFVALGAMGALLAVRAARARPVAVLLGATILQALVLAAFDRSVGSRDFYLPFKMVYLAVVPCAVLGAFALATGGAVVSARVPWVRSAAAVAPLVIAVLLVGRRVPLKRQHSPISEPALAAGRWARDAVPPGCVDYFSQHWLTGYWLHLDVLGNPRLSDRMRAETFEFRDTVGKWIEGRGLPYGIVEDLAAIPRDARVDMIPLRVFGAAAVVKNARPAPGSSLGSDPESTLCRGK